tara:strand:+ start:992 stop:1972 length:981 start_codon:yes stop_codon:yes gene_type:complete
MVAQKDAYASVFLSLTDVDLPVDFINDYDKYSDFRPLAKGGKAVLQTCMDNALGRVVVHKSIHPHLEGNVRERRRFMREARISAQLQHPNTIPVYEIGRDPNGNLYFTMKRIAGLNLYQIMGRLKREVTDAQQEYNLDRLLEILLQACYALANAHAHGVIHRDLKPENILVGQFGEVSLVDWGVAKIWGMPNEDRTREHKENGEGMPGKEQRPGTPLYMSPEQIIGNYYVDNRTDVWAIGVMLYELLCLEVPFKGRTVHQTFEKIIHETPVTPGNRLPKHLKRVIPSELVLIAMRAMSKKPADRQSSISEVIEQIRSFRNNKLLIS